MLLGEFIKYSREEVCKKYKQLRYIKNNHSYFLYLIYTEGDCVYVGETSNIFWRIIKHKNKCSKESIIYLQEYPDKKTVLKLEKHFIRVFKPKFNNRYCIKNQLELFQQQQVFPSSGKR